MPSSPQASLQEGIRLDEGGQLQAARAIYEQVLVQQPANLEALYRLGIVCARLRDHEGAAQVFTRAIARLPGERQLHANLGLSLRALKRFGEALAAFDEAVALEPSCAELHFHRAVVLGELRQFRRARASLDEAIRLRPDYADAYVQRGIVLIGLKRFAAAIESFDQAIALAPAHPSAYNNRGLARTELNQLEAALGDFEQALRIQPDFAQAHNNLGVVLRDLKQLDAALRCFEEAARIAPGFVEAHGNIGIIHRQRKQLDAAIACYDRALSIQPRHAETLWNKANACLLAGRFDEGWRLFESRWDKRSFTSVRRNFSQPLWSGRQPLEGKTIVLHAEQGLGDTLQFCRYVPLVAARGARVLLEVQAPLASLLERLQGPFELLRRGDALPAFDFHCPLLSLPLAFGTSLQTIPSPQPYLTSDPARVAQWRQRLGERRSPRVGIAWSGSTTHRNDANRSIPLQQVVAALPPGLEFVSLQKELRPADAQVLREDGRIRHFGDQLADFSDTAALCDLVDVVVSVDTSVAHLSAALGRPTWVLLPHSPDWRWLLDRDDSPWYRSVRLYRQDAPGDWDGALARVAGELLAGRAIDARAPNPFQR